MRAQLSVQGKCRIDTVAPGRQGDKRVGPGSEQHHYPMRTG